MFSQLCSSLSSLLASRFAFAPSRPQLTQSRKYPYTEYASCSELYTHCICKQSLIFIISIEKFVNLLVAWLIFVRRCSIRTQSNRKKLLNLSWGYGWNRWLEENKYHMYGTRIENEWSHSGGAGCWAEEGGGVGEQPWIGAVSRWVADDWVGIRWKVFREPRKERWEI